LPQQDFKKKAQTEFKMLNTFLFFGWRMAWIV